MSILEVALLVILYNWIVGVPPLKAFFVGLSLVGSGRMAEVDALPPAGRRLGRARGIALFYLSPLFCGSFTGKAC